MFTLNDVLKITKEERRLERERCLACVGLEEELIGKIPAWQYERIRNFDPTQMVGYLENLIRNIKTNIKNRINEIVPEDEKLTYLDAIGSLPLSEEVLPEDIIREMRGNK